MSDEFSFIEKITPTKHYQKNLIKGIGDDAALYASSDKYDEIVCMDTMVEGIHFLKSTLSPFHIGYKALAVNISDIAAMGGEPLFYLVSLAVPALWNENELFEIYRGMNDIAEKYHIDLIGGDTVSTNDRLVITVTVIGKVEKGRRLLRSNARANDVVFITNTVGNSSAGLSILLEKTCNGTFSKEEQFLVNCHQQPQPQVEIGRLLATCNVRIALNDISDGVASEAHEIAEASAVKIILDANSFPIHEALAHKPFEQQLKWILYGGEDFQLIGTVGKKDWPLVQKTCEQHGYMITKVGTVAEGEGVWLHIDGKFEKIRKAGYNHFSNR